MTLEQSEADLKRAVDDYLTYQQNLGHLMFFRLNAGTFIQEGKNQRLIRGCPAGTSDYFVLKNGIPYFVELKKPKGKLIESQLRFMELVDFHGGVYSVCRDIQQLRLLMESGL